jgi:DNA adenine methylase
MATPIVKWVGGKTHLLDELLIRLPTAFRRYYEPFAGGLALFFALQPRRAVLADLNADLVATYQAVADDPEAVIANLAALKANQGDNHYYAIRSRWNAREERDGPADRAAMFIYLNKTCFNGLWRVSRTGRFNSSMGDAETFEFDGSAIEAAAAALAGASLRCADFEAVLAGASLGDLIYADPPYDGAYAGYDARRFGEAAQVSLASMLRAAAARGASVIVSNSDTPLIRRLYDGWQIDEVAATHSVGGGGRARQVRELLICSPGTC